MIFYGCPGQLIFHFLVHCSKEPSLFTEGGGVTEIDFPKSHADCNYKPNGLFLFCHFCYFWVIKPLFPPQPYLPIPRSRHTDFAIENENSTTQYYCFLNFHYVEIFFFVVIRTTSDLRTLLILGGLWGCIVEYNLFTKWYNVGCKCGMQYTFYLNIFSISTYTEPTLNAITCVSG